MGYSRVVAGRMAIKAGRLAVCLDEEGGGIVVLGVGSDQIRSGGGVVSFFSTGEACSAFTGIGDAFIGSS